MALVMSWCLMVSNHYPSQCWLDIWKTIKNIYEWTLTHRQLETHGSILSTVATDALVLMHQAINAHSADYIVIVLDQFHIDILQL